VAKELRAKLLNGMTNHLNHITDMGGYVRQLGELNACRHFGSCQLFATKRLQPAKNAEILYNQMAAKKTILWPPGGRLLSTFSQWLLAPWLH